MLTNSSYLICNNDMKQTKLVRSDSLQWTVLQAFFARLTLALFC